MIEGHGLVLEADLMAWLYHDDEFCEDDYEYGLRVFRMCFHSPPRTVLSKYLVQFARHLFTGLTLVCAYGVAGSSESSVGRWRSLPRA